MRTRLILSLRLIATAPLISQTPNQIKLKPADATLHAEFTIVTSTRELRDGRILVTDPRDRGVVVASFATGSVTKIGRVGGGPGEYPFAHALARLAGDSSIMLDYPHQPWTLFDGDRIVGAAPPTAPAVRLGGGRIVRGPDSAGHVLEIPTLMQKRRTTDSMALELVVRSTGHVDTIGWLRPTAPELVPNEPATTFLVSESAQIAFDGWVVVVRMEPYRIDWRMPDGRWVLGAPIQDIPVKFDGREKRFFASVHGDNDYSRKRLDHPPDVVPPYSNESPPRPTPDGKVLIERTPTADHPNIRYDLVNRRGELEGQVSMPMKQRIVGFGIKSVYVVVRDADDIERIERHPWP